MDLSVAIYCHYQLQVKSYFIGTQRAQFLILICDDLSAIWDVIFLAKTLRRYFSAAYFSGSFNNGLNSENC